MHTSSPCTSTHSLPRPPPCTLRPAPWPQHRTSKKKGKTRSPEVRLACNACFCTLPRSLLDTTPIPLMQVPLQLQVTGTGRTIMVDASPTMTAARLSRVVAAQTGMPRGSFALYHGSKSMCGTLEEI
eukprot:scaffold135561_cov145-Phaeocystis_antarctica.AAC.1